MANIAKLPNGRDLAARPVHNGLSYGPHCTVGVIQDTATLYRASDSATLAIQPLTGRFTAQLKLLDPTVLPYVNSFLKGTGYQVIKNWRTGEYRFKREGNGAPQGTPSQPTPQPEAAFSKPVLAGPLTTKPVIEDDEAPIEHRGAVITISHESRSALSAIPGVEFPPKVALKGAGRGMTNVGGIVVPTTDLHTLQDAWNLRQSGKPGAVLLTGPAGTAKTMLVRSFAASLGVPYLKVDAGSVRTADDWAGAFRQDPNTKTWAHQWSPFARVLRAGEPAIVHIDELTRTESPAALNAFMGLLDETGTMLVPDANAVLRMPKGILVVATANIGPEFVGTLPLDGAVRQRFPYGIRMAPPPEVAEAKLLVERTGVTNEVAVRLVRMAVEQRKHRDDAQRYPSGAVISTRVLLSIAERIGSCNADPRSAVVSTLHGQFDPGDDAAISLVIDSQFPKGWSPSADGGPSLDDTATEGAAIVTERHYFVPSSLGCAWQFSDGTPCARDASDKVHL